MKTYSLWTICGAMMLLPLLGMTSAKAVGASLKAPPSAEIAYRITARKSGINLAGEAWAHWQQDGRQYRLQNGARANLLGKIQESSSHGSLDAQGLQPQEFAEKRYRKSATTTSFDREQTKILFSENTPSLDLPAGAQDRASAIWQLSTLARANPEKFSMGSEWVLYVAGRRDAETWRFKVVGRETLASALGNLPSVRLVKQAPADSKEQQVDLWLAPGLEWYPVKIRFRDADGDFVEQLVEKISRK